MNLDVQALNQVADFSKATINKVISSNALFGKDKSIVILHDGQRYLLSMTKLRKLILTK